MRKNDELVRDLCIEADAGLSDLRHDVLVAGALKIARDEFQAKRRAVLKRRREIKRLVEALGVLLAHVPDGREHAFAEMR